MTNTLLCKIGQYSRSIYLYFGIFSCLYIVIFGYGTTSDTLSYIELDPIRTAGYPLILKIYNILFSDYYLYIISFSQIFLWISLSYIFSKKISEIFEINSNYKFLFLLILCVPLNPQQEYGTTITTEGFAFALSLCILLITLKNYENNRSKYIIYTLILFIVAQLIRPQLSFYLFVFVFLSFIFILIGHKKKSLLTFLLGLIGFLFATNIDKTYHYIKHDFFGQVPFVGMQLIALPFDTVSEQAILKIENLKDRDVLLKMKDRARERGLHPDQRYGYPFTPYREIFAYATAYNQIIREVNRNYVREIFPELSKSEQDSYLTHLAIELVLTGLKNEPLKLIKAYLSNILHIGFGNWVWGSICLITLMVSFILFFQTQTVPLYMILLLASSHFINISIVSVLEPVLFRYSFYTGLPLGIVILAFCLSSLHRLSIRKVTS
jgi:hypothetical protein